jgi:MarR family transcriptional regulator, organic hydroperoxide resistance regulator
VATISNNRADETTAAAAEAWRLIFDLGTVHRAHVLAAAAEHDLSPPQLFLLRRLEPGTPTPMSELAAFFGCDASNITGLVDRLEARGVLERRVPAHDRRVKQIVLTDAGKRLREQALERLHVPPEALARLSPRDQRELRDILRRAIGSGLPARPDFEGGSDQKV